MYRRGLLLFILLPFIWLLLACVQPRSSQVTTAQVKGIQSVQVTFDRTANTPDPNQIFDLVNKTRANQGVAPLIADESLTEIARLRAQDMAARGYYAHRSPNGVYYYDLLAEQGIMTEYSCENLDMEFGLDALAYVTSWLSSKAGHKECLLNPQTTAAGYAAVEIPRKKPLDQPTYVVVAIHGTNPKKR